MKKTHKTVKANEFIGRDTCRFNKSGIKTVVCPSTTASKQVHDVWKRIRTGTFVIPQEVCAHDSWEVYDADKAGCVMCGAQHICSGCVGEDISQISCPVESNEEGHLVCTITGLCVREISFSTSEYVDTAMMVAASSAAASSAGTNAGPIQRVPAVCSQARSIPNMSLGRESDMDNDSSVPDVIKSYVNQILCSQEWTRSMDVEEARLENRRRMILSKVLKEFKCSNPRMLPVIPNILSLVQASVGCTRDSASTISRATKEERDSIANWCSENIYKHICMLNSIGGGECDIPQCKLRGCTVGLLYLMRQGVIVQGVVVLPKLNRLKEILPMESHLQQMFGIKGRCITETENMVKLAVKSLDRDSLRKCGVACINNRFQF